MRSSKAQSGQVLVIVAVWLVALIGSAALILLTGSVEWQRNQLQQLADQAALDSALMIGVGCTAGSASVVNGIVYFSTLHGRTYGLDARTGRLLWWFPDGQYTPVVADEHRLYVVGYRRVFAFVHRAGSSPRLTIFWPPSGRAPARSTSPAAAPPATPAPTLSPAA